MSVSNAARPYRIDQYPKDIQKRFTNAVSSLNAAILDARAFTTFMHANPKGEFTQEDRDKYSALFVNAVQALYAAIAQLQPLQDLENEVITVEDFLAASTTDVAAFSAQFD